MQTVSELNAPERKERTPIPPYGRISALLLSDTASGTIARTLWDVPNVGIILIRHNI